MGARDGLAQLVDSLTDVTAAIAICTSIDRFPQDTAGFPPITVWRLNRPLLENFCDTVVGALGPFVRSNEGWSLHLKTFS